MPIDDDQLYELNRIKMLSELQDDLNAWAKKRFFIISIAIAIIGLFGFKTVLDNSIQSFIKDPINREIAEAEETQNTLKQAVDQAKETITRLNVLGEQAEEMMEEARKTVRDAETAVQQAKLQISLLQDSQKKVDENLSVANRAIDNMESNITNVLVQAESAETRIDQIFDDVFHLQSEQNSRKARSERELEAYIERIKFFEQSVSDLLLKFDPIRPEAEQFVAKYEEYRTNADKELDETRESLSTRSTKTITVYRVSDANNVTVERTETIAGTLTNEGYRATPWMTSSENYEDAIKEISDEFGINSDILRSGPEDILIITSAAMNDANEISNDISSLIRRSVRDTSIKIRVKSQNLDPMEKHLKKSQNVQYDKSDAVLIFVN